LKKDLNSENKDAKNVFFRKPRTNYSIRLHPLIIFLDEQPCSVLVANSSSRSEEREMRDGEEREERVCAVMQNAFPMLLFCF